MTTAPEPAPAPTFSQPPAPPKRRWGRIIVIVVAAMVALIIIFGVAVFFLVNESTEDAQKVSDQFVTAVQNGDGAAAYALTGPAFREATTEAQVTELVQNLSTLVTKDKSSPKREGHQRKHRERQDRRLHLHMKGTARRRTGGSEPSQYPEEEKATAIPSVAASERGTAQTMGVIAVQALLDRGCGTMLGSDCTTGRGVTNHEPSRRLWKGRHRG